MGISKEVLAAGSAVAFTIGTAGLVDIVVDPLNRHEYDAAIMGPSDPYSEVFYVSVNNRTEDDEIDDNRAGDICLVMGVGGLAGVVAANTSKRRNQVPTKTSL